MQHADPSSYQVGVVNPYKFNGIERIEDHNLGLDLTQNRPYDAIIGRFTGVDPLAEVAPDWTPYRFGFNNPITFSDPLGLYESKLAKEFNSSKYFDEAVASEGDFKSMASLENSFLINPQDNGKNNNGNNDEFDKLNLNAEFIVDEFKRFLVQLDELLSTEGQRITLEEAVDLGKWENYFEKSSRFSDGSFIEGDLSDELNVLIQVLPTAEIQDIGEYFPANPDGSKHKYSNNSPFSNINFDQPFTVTSRGNSPEFPYQIEIRSHNLHWFSIVTLRFRDHGCFLEFKDCID